MDKQKNKRTPLDKTDSYLRTQRIRIWLVILAGLILASGVLAWLFFGTYNITVSGYAQVVKNANTYCVVSSTDIDKVKPGMTAWVDNFCGTVINIEEDLITYDQIVYLYGYSSKHLHVKEDETYYFVDLDITEADSGYRKYTIITDTVTPFEYFFGGVGK